MRLNTQKTQKIEIQKLKLAIFIPVIVVILMILVFFFERGMQWDFKTGGVFPRSLSGLWGILTMPFIHSDLKHLLNNLPAFLFLATTLYFFYSEIANITLLLLYILSGLILWIIGRDSWHIGASGVIYALAFFLFFSGIMRKHVPLIAISLIVAFIYGSMVWYLFPLGIQNNISWEGHLSGAASGGLIAFIFRNKGPQRPKYEWEDAEDDNEDENGEDLHYLESESDIDET